MDKEESIDRRYLFSSFGIKLSLIAWLAMIGVDFLLHAGILANLYTTKSQFLLPPMEAFRRIPIGYLSFLFTAFLLVWISFKTKVNTPKKGFSMGLYLGLAIWLTQSIGMYSITTANVLTLISWTIGQSVEMAIAGGLIGLAIKRKDLRRVFLIAIVMSLVLIITTIMLQSFGFVKTIKIQ